MKKKIIFVCAIPLFVLLGLIIEANYALEKGSDEALPQKGTLSPKMPEYKAAFEFDFSPGQVEKYKVKRVATAIDKKGLSSPIYSIEAIIEVTVANSDPNRGYEIQVDLSLISVDVQNTEEGLGSEPVKAEKLTMHLNLPRKGGLDYDNEKLNNLFKKQGRFARIYGMVFSGMGIIFPRLPKEWHDSSITGQKYTYTLIGPVTIKAHRMSESRGIYEEQVSNFSEGMVKSGYMEFHKYIKDKLRGKTEISVFLVSESQK